METLIFIFLIIVIVLQLFTVFTVKNIYSENKLSLNSLRSLLTSVNEYVRKSQDRNENNIAYLNAQLDDIKAISTSSKEILEIRSKKWDLEDKISYQVKLANKYKQAGDTKTFDKMQEGITKLKDELNSIN